MRDRAIVPIEQPARLGDPSRTERWALVMDLVTGASLQRLTSLGAMPPSVATEIVGEVARVLEKVWRAPGPDGQPLKILHRDIKPSNLQLNAGGELRVLDFGIAKADFRSRDAQVTMYGTGTRGFIAPERLDGVDSLAGDVFSLGVTAHTLIGGERPYKPKRDDPPETARIDQTMIALFTRMRSPKPSDRPSAVEVEDQCAKLRQRSDGMTLREWAERNVPRAIALKFSDEVVGTVLIDSGPVRGKSRGNVTGSTPLPARGNTGAQPVPAKGNTGSQPVPARGNTGAQPVPSRVEPIPSSRLSHPPSDPRASRPAGPASLRPMTLPDALGRRPPRDDDEDTVIAPRESYVHALDQDLELEEVEEIEELEPDPEPLPQPPRKAPPGQTTVVAPPPMPLSPAPPPPKAAPRTVPAPAPAPQRAPRSVPPPPPPVPEPAPPPPRVHRSVVPQSQAPRPPQRGLSLEGAPPQASPPQSPPQSPQSPPQSRTGRWAVAVFALAMIVLVGGIGVGVAGGAGVWWMWPGGMAHRRDPSLPRVRPVPAVAFEAVTEDPEAPAPPRPRTLTFSSIPLGADVYVDREPVGQTPVTGLVIAEGRHEVILVSDFEKLVRPIEVGKKQPVRYVWKGGDNWELHF